MIEIKVYISRNKMKIDKDPVINKSTEGGRKIKKKLDRCKINYGN